MQQSTRWNPCRFVKTLAYFGAVPMLGGAGWLQQLLGLPMPPLENGLQAMTTDQIVLTAADTAMAGLLDQALVEQGYRAYALPPDRLPEAIAQLPDEVRREVVGAIGVISSSELSPTGPSAIADLLAQVPQRRVIFDFRQPVALDSLWGPVDDVVMGGVSESRIEKVATGALFSGRVSTENSGGFASVRTRNLDPLDLSAYEGIQLRVRGDGNRYKFLLRDSDRWDGVAYSASFDTVPNDWMTVQIRFDELVPVFRARTLEESDGINRQSVRAFQVMLSKFEYDGELNPRFEPGPFELAIESIEAYGDASRAVWLAPGLSAPQVHLELSSTVLRVAAIGDNDSSLIALTASDEPSGTLSPTQAAELCVRALETPALRYQTVAVRLGVGQPLANWQGILKAYAQPA